MMIYYHMLKVPTLGVVCLDHDALPRLVPLRHLVKQGVGVFTLLNTLFRFGFGKSDCENEILCCFDPRPLAP